MLRLSSLLFLSLVLLAGCSDNDTGDTLFEPAPTLSATVKRTSNGIPHIKTDDWASLGYGYGYAYAQDNFCMLMKEVVIANSQSQRYLSDDGDLAEDFVFPLIGDEAEIQSGWIDGLEENSRRLVQG